MKTSTKIITTTGGLILALAITSMVIFKRDVGAQIRERIAIDTHRLHEADSFHSVEISSGWDVEIRQDTTWTVEIIGGNAGDNSLVHFENGLLRLGERSNLKPGMYTRAKIFLPVLNYLAADSGAVIRINGFRSDSVALKINAGCQIIGAENQFEKMVVHSAGPVDFTMTNSDE